VKRRGLCRNRDFRNSELRRRKENQRTAVKVRDYLRGHDI